MKQENFMKHADTQNHLGTTRVHERVNVLEFRSSYFNFLA